MITREEVKKRLHNIACIFLVSALISMCGFIVAPELAIREIDPNTLTVFKFLIISAFVVHIMGMVSMGVLLVGDTMERIVSNNDED